jgi:hypothetical protein
MDWLPLADISGDLGPIVACIGTFMVPIVWILTAHQRKMAMIIHGQHQQQQQQAQQAPQSDALTSEVRELRQIVYQQSIALDNLADQVRKSNGQLPQETIAARLNQDRSST